MFFSLYPHTRRLQSLLERLLIVSLGGIVLALLLAGILLLVRQTQPHGTLLGLGAGGLALLYGVQAWQARRRVQRAALEAHLLAQPLDAPTLAACLGRGDHLWGQSLVVRALRVAGAQPPLGRLRPDEHLRRLHGLFRRFMAPLRPTLLRPNLLGVAALLALWMHGTLPDTSGLGYGVVLMAGLLALEILAGRTVWQAQDALDGLTLGLADWMLGQADLPFAPSPPPYRHQRLYLDQPWTSS